MQGQQLSTRSSTATDEGQPRKLRVLFAPTSVVPLVLAEIVGAALACATIRYLWPRVGDAAEAVQLPHESEREQEVGVG